MLVFKLLSHRTQSQLYSKKNHYILYATLVNVIITRVFLWGFDFLCNYTLCGPRQKPQGVSRGSPQLHL